MRQLIGPVTLVLIVLLAAPFAWADGPATVPAPPAAPAKLGDGRLEYSSPPGWEMVQSASNDKTAAYISADHAGILAIQLLPADAVVDSSAGPSLVRRLKAIHTKNKQKMLIVPTIVKDKRFALAIHERYEDAEGNVNDELHLYNKVGPLSVMLTVNAKTANDDTAKQTHAIGEDVMLSAKFVRKTR